MAWSDKAREAALIARRQHATGKKVQPTKWYHGGSFGLQGDKVQTKRGGGLAWSSSVYATKNIGMALNYAAGRRDSGAVYVVKLQSPLKYKHGDAYTSNREEMRNSLMYRRGGNMAVKSRLGLPVVARLPRAKGRASRGKY